VEIARPHVATNNTHGTGCTLSAAIAAHLALAADLETAVIKARDYLHLCLRAAYDLGAGSGPPHHLAPYVRTPARLAVLAQLPHAAPRMPAMPGPAARAPQVSANPPPAAPPPPAACPASPAPGQRPPAGPSGCAPRPRAAHGTPRRQGRRGHGPTSRRGAMRSRPAKRKESGSCPHWPR